MVSVIYKRRTCRLCGGTKLQTVLRLHPSPIADQYLNKSFAYIMQPSYPLSLRLCRQCGQVQLNDIVPPPKIYIDYTYVTSVSVGLTKHFQNYTQDVVKRLNPPKHSLVIDIGSNDGTLLSEFKKRHMNVLGIDPAKQIAAIATKKGIPTIPEFFTPKLATSILRLYGPATIITANNVVANIDNLDDFIRSVKTLIVQNSVFIFESFYLKDIIKNLVFDCLYHEHISYFSVTPLIKFFKKHELEIFDVVQVPTKGGSLRYMIQLADGPNKISPSVKRFMHEEQRLGLQNTKLYASFAKRINTRKHELLGFLGKLKSKNISVAGFGASASTTTLLYHFELNDKIDFLIDENMKKIGSLSPGCHIPVFSPDSLYQKKPDYVIILAWRYASLIIKKYSKYRKLGGKFIIPLPKLKII